MTATIGGLRPHGELLVLGAASEPLAVASGALITTRRSVVGHPSGTSNDSENTLRFAARTGVRPMLETVPLERGAQAYQRMLSGQARFRMVLTMS